MKTVRTAQLNIDENKKLRIHGLAIQFNEPTVIHDKSGDYTELIKKEALNNCDLSDVCLLLNHDEKSVPLARNGKTMNLSITDKGLEVDALLPDTEDGKAVYEAVKRGDLSGMSFAFKISDNGSTFDPKTRTRTITAIEKVYECSIVTFPAYEGTTIEARNKHDSKEYECLKRDVIILANKILIGV